MSEKSNLKEIAGLFFKLGLIAFGGPAAHIAMMEEEVVKKRKWMTQAHFLDLVGATNLIPGPNSTEMTMHCGHERGGWRGLLLGFIKCMGNCRKLSRSFMVSNPQLLPSLSWQHIDLEKGR